MNKVIRTQRLRVFQKEVTSEWKRSGSSVLAAALPACKQAYLAGFGKRACKPIKSWPASP